MKASSVFALANLAVSCFHMMAPVYSERTIAGLAYRSVFTENLWSETTHNAPLNSCTIISFSLTSASLFVANNEELYKPKWRSYLTHAIPVIGILHYLVAVLRIAHASHATLPDHNVVSVTSSSVISTFMVMLMPYVNIISRYAFNYSA